MDMKSIQEQLDEALKDCEGCTVNCTQGIDIQASAQQLYRYIA